MDVESKESPGERKNSDLRGNCHAMRRLGAGMKSEESPGERKNSNLRGNLVPPADLFKGNGNWAVIATKDFGLDGGILHTLGKTVADNKAVAF